MYEINCSDIYGNTIYNFFQWDVDQKIVINLDGCDEDYLNIAPEFHYSNAKTKDAYVVRSVVSNRDTITAPVPNILLQEPYPIQVYVYLTDSRHVSSQKTILYSEIPVRKRDRPSDYLYVENIERITAEKIKQEIEADIANLKGETINDINDKKNAVIDSMNKSEKFITAVKEDAQNFITNTKNDTINYISGQRLEFEQTGRDIVAQAQKIKDDTLGVYTDTVDVAGKTATKIEAEIRKMMLENGVGMKITDDGHGNCVMSIIVNKSNTKKVN